MIVTVSGLSGLTNAYRAVPSICGSAAVSGASRWLDARLGTGARPENRPAPSASVAAAATIVVRTRLPGNGKVEHLLSDGSGLVRWPRRRSVSPGGPPARCRPLASLPPRAAADHGSVREGPAVGSPQSRGGGEMTRGD